MKTFTPELHKVPAFSHFAKKLIGWIAVVDIAGAWSLSAARADNPPPNLPPGQHSTIVMGDDEEVRDDEFAQMIKDAITASGKTPSSIKLFLQECYGGGVLPAVSNMANSLGIPFVGGSAASADETSWGPSDLANDGTKADWWTGSLAGAINGSTGAETVSSIINMANTNDPAAPGGAEEGPEHPQSASSGGGSAVMLGPGQAVVFSGANSNMAHISNVNDMAAALGRVVGNANVQSSSTTNNAANTQAALQNMLNSAANKLRPGDELIIYIDDHGDTDFDVREWWNSISGQSLITASSSQSFATSFSLNSGWVSGLRGNLAQGHPVNPGILLAAPGTGTTPLGSLYNLSFDGHQVTMPPGLVDGVETFLPIDPSWVQAGDNFLSIVAEPGASTLTLSELTLVSGPISELNSPVPEPGTLALLIAGAVLLAMYRKRR